MARKQLRNIARRCNYQKRLSIKQRMGKGESENIFTLILVSVAILIGFSIGGTFVKQSVNSLVHKESEVNTVLLEEVAAEINKTLPIMVDKDTKLFSVSIVNGNTFQYNYVLINYAQEEIDPELLKNNNKDRIRNYICTSPDMKLIVENNIPVSYAYYGKNQKYIVNIVIDTNKCN